MLTCVLDASAAVRFVDQEAGSDRVEELARLARQNQCRLIISAVNWGEVVYILIARRYPDQRLNDASDLLKRTLEIVDASSDRAARAGLLRVKYRIPYADAFGVELASDSPDHLLVTADFDVKPAENDIHIEFLPPKPKA